MKSFLAKDITRKLYIFTDGKTTRRVNLIRIYDKKNLQKLKLLFFIVVSGLKIDNHKRFFFS